MYLNAITSHQLTDKQNNKLYVDTIIAIGDTVLGNVNFNLNRKIDRFEFIKATILNRFDNNLILTKRLYKPVIIDKLITKDGRPIINDLTVTTNIENQVNDKWDANEW